ncbi:MAG: hypothetical protein IKM51_01420, partial [Oscillospiraceae bacterium]|nr:hypothetical protein [Oscillospiraceae bacterium]
QPQGGLLNVDEALNVTWETSFIPDMYNIQYWDGSAWDQRDCINGPEVRYSDHDFQNNIEETVRFRIVATLGDDVEVRSRPFSITWGSPVSCQWNDTECTVTLENKNIDGTVVASVYENGKITYDPVCHVLTESFYTLAQIVQRQYNILITLSGGNYEVYPSFRSAHWQTCK